VRILLGTVSAYLHIVTLEGLGINTVANLKGKRVSTGLTGSGTEIKALRVLDVYGVTPDNLRMHVHQDYPEAAQALKEASSTPLVHLGRGVVIGTFFCGA
jgi:uncharacterized protein